MLKHLTSPRLIPLVLVLLSITAFTPAVKAAWNGNQASLSLGRFLFLRIEDGFPDTIQLDFSPSMAIRQNRRLSATLAYYSRNCAALSYLARPAGGDRSSNVLADFYVGELYYHCGEIGPALASWRRSGAFPYYLRLCREDVLRPEHNEKAAEQCTIATELDPQSAVAIDYLALTYMYLHQYQEAAGIFDRAVELDASVPGLLLRAAEAHRQVDQPEIAKKYLEQALGMFPEDARVYVALGKLLLSQGDSTVARGYLERATVIDAQNADAYAALGRMEFDQGRYLEAQKHLERAAKLDVSQPEYLLLLADVYCTMHHANMAEASYLQALALLPDNQGVAEKAKAAPTRCR